MNKDKKSDVVCINLEFLRSQSMSKQEKVKEFWKFLDSQDTLKPYEPPKLKEEEKAYTYDSRSSSEAASSTKIPSTKPKQKIKKEVKEKKRDDDSCKLEKYLREDLKYADTVEVTYDEINAEIEDFQRRLLRCNCENEKCDCEKKSK